MGRDDRHRPPDLGHPTFVVDPGRDVVGMVGEGRDPGPPVAVGDPTQRPGRVLALVVVDRVAVPVEQHTQRLPVATAQPIPEIGVGGRVGIGGHNS